MSDFQINDGVLVKYCGFESKVIVPDSVMYIEESAFSGNRSVTDIVFPKGLCEIAPFAFAGCTGIERVVFTESPLKIGEGAFKGCNALRTITINSKNGPYASVGNALIYKRTKALAAAHIDNDLPKEIRSILPYAVFGNKRKQSLSIPEGTEKICDFAFAGTLVDALSLPDSLLKIGKHAFDGCGIKTLSVGSCLSEIGDFAFSGCEISKFYIPSSLTSIGKNPFVNGNFPNITVSEENRCFYVSCDCLVSQETGTLICGKSLERIPCDVRIIGALSFYNAKGKTLEIPECTTRIEEGAFKHCTELKRVKISESVSFMGHQVFYECDELTSLNILGTPTLYKDSVAASDSLSIVAPNLSPADFGDAAMCAVKGMGDEYIKNRLYPEETAKKYRSMLVYNRKSRFNEIYKHASLVYFCIKEGVFDEYCLQAVFDTASKEGNAEYIGLIMENGIKNRKNKPAKEIKASDLFISLDDLTLDPLDEDTKKLSVRAEWEYDKNEAERAICIRRYKGNEKSVEIPEKIGGFCVTSLSEGVFRGSNVVSVIIPKNVLALPGFTFEGCESLESVTFRGRLYEIGDNCFMSCRSLKKFICPKDLERIGSCAFAESGLQELYMESNVREICDDAFYGCSELKKIVPYSKENPHHFLENGCLVRTCDSMLVAVQRDFEFPNVRGLKIGQCFRMSKNIVRLELPPTVTEVECNAFEGCEFLESVTFPEGLCALPSFVLCDCKRLTRVYVPASVTEFGLFTLDGSNSAVVYTPKGSKASEHYSSEGVTVTEV